VIRDSSGRFATPGQGIFDRPRRALHVCAVGACLAIGAYLVQASAAPHAEALSPAQASKHATPSPGPPPASTPDHASTSASFDAANLAWQRGDYIAALNGYLQVLNARGGDAYLEAIALTTGELYHTYELTSDGRAGRFSPRGRYIIYETGLETSRRTTILRNDGHRAVVVDLPGVSATLTPDDSKVAYLRINETEDVKNASRSIESATLTDPRRNALVQTLAWLVARDSTIVVRDIADGYEIELPTPAMLKTALTYAADGRSLFFLGTREGNDTRTDIYSISEASDGPALAVDAGGLKSAPLVAANGAALVYVVPSVSPLRLPVLGGAAGAGGAGRAGRAGEAGGAGRAEGAAAPAPRPPSTFAIVDLASKGVSVVSGTAPALSGDGKTLAYVAREGNEYSLMIGPTTGMPAAVKRTSQRLDRPALSADGGRVAWQMMPRDDWEIYVADVAGPALARERRVTRDIQHDVLPRFITANRLLAMAGEPRHRRSYLYELETDSTLQAGVDGQSALEADSEAGRVTTGIRLFHNNTVRTIAPEYEWAASPDGTRLLVGAERDGDTVSPPRGVYLIDLSEKVTKADVVGRLRDNLRAETALRAANVRAFQPIAADVRPIVSRVSVDRIFAYEKSLFDFDSKHISKPGNRLAAEYLFKAYKAFGYSPEYQWFDPPAQIGSAGTRGGTVQPRATANVVATLGGTVNPELVYVISSHYDSVEGGPGADDDTSGTAALLEAARVLAGHPLPATVKFASMTGEESGLLGSREFVRRAVEQKLHIVGVLNNDMIGWMNDERMDNTIRYSNAGIRDIQHGAAMLFTKLITYDARYWKGTDAMSFYDAYGDIIGGIGSYPVLASPYYHQPTDVIENLNHQLIAETGKTTIATIMMLASSPSPLMNLKVDSYTGGTASVSWTPSPEKAVVSYVVEYGPSSAPSQNRLTVTAPRATLSQVRPGTVVSVKAITARGLEGWGWARVRVNPPVSPRSTPH
jgi:hypothetical protein